jgi:hemolysin activation/secretion protein
MFQAPWESGIEDNYSLFGSYDLPVFTPRLRLNVYAGYSEFDISAEDSPIDFLGNGSFYGGILRFNVLQTGGWFFDVTGSFSYERSKVTPSLFPTTASDVKMYLWGAGTNLHRSDDMSTTSVGFNRFESMDGSDRDEFTLARPDASPDFRIYAGSAAHSQYLDPEKVQRLSGSFRLIDSSGRLVPAKMTTFGGLYSVRGYEEDEIVADGGILASAQYEFDLIRHDRFKETDEAEEKETEAEAKELEFRKLAPLVFFDYGRAKIKDNVPGEEGTQELSSIGVGVAAELGDSLSGAVYYGWPLRATNDTDRNEGRFNFVFIYRF